LKSLVSWAMWMRAMRIVVFLHSVAEAPAPVWGRLNTL